MRKSVGATSGKSPYARGKFFNVLVCKSLEGITPVYTGNFSAYATNDIIMDNPRIHGGKCYKIDENTAPLGITPVYTGKPPVSGPSCAMGRITPVCTGK